MRSPPFSINTVTCQSIAPVMQTGSVTWAAKRPLPRRREFRADQAHVHLDAGEIDFDPARRETAGRHLHLERLDHGNRPRAHRQFDRTAGWQGHRAGLALQVAGRIRLDHDIGLGQQQRRKLVADDHHEGDQQDADHIYQYFPIHQSGPGHRPEGMRHFASSNAVRFDQYQVFDVRTGIQCATNCRSDDSPHGAMEGRKFNFSFSWEKFK